jgi:hypothetical protein
MFECAAKSAIIRMSRHLAYKENGCAGIFVAFTNIFVLYCVLKGAIPFVIRNSKSI